MTEPHESVDAQLSKLRVAVVQAAPVFLDRQKSTDKACAFIAEAAQRGARIIAFPESFIPSHPTWVEVLPVLSSQSAHLYKQLWKNAVEVPGPEVLALQAACRENSVYAVVGITEKKKNTTGTLYNTLLFIGPGGECHLKHQKLVPTVGERVVHGPGETGRQAAIQTEFGALSGLICGENSNPLAQYGLALDYPVVHVASWPQHFDSSYDMQRATLIVSRGLAYALKCFVLNSIAVVDDDLIEAYGSDPQVRDFLQNMRNKGGSSIIGPGGDVIAGPMGPGEGILYGDCDLDDIIVPKQVHDYAGHYNRPELFKDLFA